MLNTRSNTTPPAPPPGPAHAPPRGPSPGPSLGPRECFQRYRALAFRWARAHGLHADDAADCVQEAFASLVRHRPAFVNAAAQLAWLRRVTSNAAVDAIRRRQRSRRAPITDVPCEPGADPLTHDQRAALADAMLAISDQQRLVLLAKAVEGLTFAQIAVHLGVAEPTAKTHFRRALVAVRAATLHLAPGDLTARPTARGLTLAGSQRPLDLAP